MMTSGLEVSRNYSYLAIAALFGFLSFMMLPSAYTWGEQDMMPFFERVFDANFLSSDFFTNTTVIKNPRWIFGYFVIGLSYISSLPWYKVLYILKLLLLTTAPIVYFKVLIVLIGKYCNEKALRKVAPFVLVTLIAMVFLKEYRYYFSVASWQNYTPAFHAYNMSMYLSFIGILIKERGRSFWLYVPVFFISCFIHPAIGLFGIAFYALCLFPYFKTEVKKFLPVLFSGLVAVVLVKLLFASSATLSTEEFISIYVKERHPWHYSFTDFRNIKGDWEIFFIGMNVLFSIPLLYGVAKKMKHLWILSLCMLLAYDAAIVLQFVFIDVIPVKLIAYLGVSRFTTFGYWMLIISWAIFIAHLKKNQDAMEIPSLSFKNFAIIILNLIFVGILFIDHPFKTYYNNRKAYYDFIQSTDENAVFQVYSAPLNTDMRMIGRRSVFISDEFPFTEDYIKEYGERFKLMFGSRQEELFGRSFYRTLQPEDFNKISKKYQLDYIVVEQQFSKAFEAYKPVWKNHRHRIYSIKDFN